MKKWIAVALVLVMLLSFTGCNAQDYKSAVSAMEAGQYTEAAAMLEALGDYKDSADLLKQCRYALAEQDFTAGNYEAAKAAFLTLSGYEDSAEYVNKRDYAVAVAAFEAGEYENALETFTALGEYSDAAAYVTRTEDAMLKAAIAGQWNSSVFDLTDIVMEYIDDETLNRALAESEFAVGMNLTLTFGEDAAVGFNYDDMDGMKLAFESALEKYLLYIWEANLAESNLTLDDLYEECGTSDVNELCQQLYGASIADATGGSDALVEMLDSIAEGFVFEADYTIENGKIDVDGEVLTYDEATDTLQMDTSAVEWLVGTASLAFSRQ